MKEVTYEDWQKNPTPRMMWVWDHSEKAKQQRKVIYFIDPKLNLNYPVVALSEVGTTTEPFKHCAEIEKQRRMTKKELARWLREKPTREYKHFRSDDAIVSCYYDYIERTADEELDDTFLIREDDGEWREPLIEEE